ncbi:MAG: CBS domain-containing protein [Candidatus Syntrophoarchaeum caldarius]|uniref:CBS domain-containing protein n=1 Tax=Candidatus Syntropharchaeum caldarium TaxID=1838285 RepID=A0A1F2PDG1_9EURY|nr:MAG: CBS domain-containing protein [Candidatus Syntrophoarchaeum caldarius]
MISVRDYMSEHSIFFPPNKKVGKVIEVMKALDHDGAPVIIETDGQKHLIGIVTLRDLVGSNPDDPVSKVMTKDVVKVSPDESIVSVAGVMAYNHIHHVPVVDDGKFIGFLTTTDILRACIENMVSENVEKVVKIFKSLDRNITVESGRIKVDKLVPTQKYLDSDELQLRLSEFNKGIVYPIIITKKNDKAYIIDGHHRAYAAKQRGFEEIPVFVIKGDLGITDAGDRIGLKIDELEIVDLQSQ